MSNNPNEIQVNWNNVATTKTTTQVSNIISNTPGNSNSNPLITSCNESTDSLIGYETFTKNEK